MKKILVLFWLLTTAPSLLGMEEGCSQCAKVLDEIKEKEDAHIFGGDREQLGQYLENKRSFVKNTEKFSFYSKVASVGSVGLISLCHWKYKSLGKTACAAGAGLATRLSIEFCKSKAKSEFKNSYDHYKQFLEDRKSELEKYEQAARQGRFCDSLSCKRLAKELLAPTMSMSETEKFNIPDHPILSGLNSSLEETFADRRKLVEKGLEMIEGDKKKLL